MRKLRIVSLGFVMAAGLLIPAVAAQANTSAPALSAHPAAVVHQASVTKATRSGGATPVLHRPDAVPAGGTYEGCPYGDVCIYPNASWNGGHPQSSQGEFFYFGCYDLVNQFGVHRVFNNQYGGATVTLYYGSGCTDPYFTIDQYTYSDVNLTPIYSISLNS